VAQLIDSLNGVSVAYAIGLTNALLALLFSFGVNVSQDQRTAIVAFVNAALIFTAHLAHAQTKRQTEHEAELAAEIPGSKE
jgi:hypothetical protein